MKSFKTWESYFASEQDAYLDSENGADENVRMEISGFTVTGNSRIGAYAVYTADSELVGIYTSDLMAEEDQIEDLVETLTVRYEIITDTFEFRFGRSAIPAMSADEIFETYQSCDDRITSNSLDPRREASFTSEAEAREAFERDWRDYGETHVSRASIGKLLCGRVAWIERNEYDADGEFDQGGEVLELSAEAYEPEED